MDKASVKAEKEIGVGGYFLRVFAFLGLIVGLAIVVGLALGAVSDEASRDLVFSLRCVTALCAIWVFPAFCVDALNPRPAFAAATSLLGVVAAGGALTAASVFDLAAPVWLEGRNALLFVYAIYVAWLIFKLRNKRVCESARRLRWAMFAAVGVPAALGIFVLAEPYVSGRLENMGKGEGIAWGIVAVSLVFPYCLAAATFGVFALKASLNRFKDKTEDASKASEGDEIESV